MSKVDIMSMTPDERLQKMVDSVNVICDENKKIQEMVEDTKEFGKPQTNKDIKKCAKKIVEACDFLIAIDKEKERRKEALAQSAFAISLGLY